MPGDASTRLADLGDRYVGLVFTASPFGATLLGIPGFDDRVPDPSAEAEAALARDLRQLAGDAQQLDVAGLGPVERTSAAVLAHLATTEAERAELAGAEFATAPFWVSAHAQVLQLLNKTNLPDRASGEAYLARLGRLPAFLDGSAERLREGTARGRTAARRSAAASVAALDAYLSSDLSTDPLLAPTAPADAPAQWHASREAAVRDAVRPAMQRFRDALRDEVLPRARDDDHVGVGWLPGGDHLYGVLARAHTTTARTPEELHALGLEVLAGLEQEYAALGRAVFGTDDPVLVRDRMRTDPALRLSSEAQLLERSHAALARAEAALPQWFGLLPPSRCALEVVPPAEAVTAAPAYYSPPDGRGREGTYWVNTHEITSRPVFDVEAILFHEALPGHHMQLSIAQKLDALPLFRRVSTTTAYVEGWGLYAERLADEMGLYSDGVARLGMLNADSWRASRLVVDTGIHALGWSYQRAVDFLLDRTTLPLSVVQPETERYIGMPGQALGYMVGRLELQRLRSRADAGRGEAFPLRGWHDAVLGGGALPLGVLDDELAAWEAARS